MQLNKIMYCKPSTTDFYEFYQTIHVTFQISTSIIQARQKGPFLIHLENSYFPPDFMQSPLTSGTKQHHFQWIILVLVKAGMDRSIYNHPIVSIYGLYTRYIQVYPFGGLYHISSLPPFTRTRIIHWHVAPKGKARNITSCWWLERADSLKSDAKLSKSIWATNKKKPLAFHYRRKFK